MKVGLLLCGVVPLITLGSLSSHVLAAGTHTGKPAIVITSPPNGAMIRGSSLTVKVAVQNFRIVAPTLVNPPILKGDAGHIHYVLDGLAHFVPNRDVSALLWHTWDGVTPGRHVITAYLSTSQHVQFPGTKQVSVAVLVEAFGPHVSRGPLSGGAMGMGGDAADPTNPLISLLMIAAGVSLRRYARLL
jgi:hypothetical protein